MPWAVVNWRHFLKTRLNLLCFLCAGALLLKREEFVSAQRSTEVRAGRKLKRKNQIQFAATIGRGAIFFWSLFRRVLSHVSCGLIRLELSISRVACISFDPLGTRQFFGNKHMRFSFLMKLGSKRIALRTAVWKATVQFCFIQSETSQGRKSRRLKQLKKECEVLEYRCSVHVFILQHGCSEAPRRHWTKICGSLRLRPYS